MTILMLLDAEFPPDVRVENEAQSLIDAGHEVHLLCYSFSGKYSTKIYQGIHLHQFPIHRQLAKKMLGLLNQIPLYKLIWKKQINRIMQEYAFDAVHFNDLPLCSLMGFVKQNFNVKVVADMHENYPFLIAEQPYMNTLFAKLMLSKKIWFLNEKEWLSNADQIVCVAEEMKSRLLKLLPNTKKIVVVPNTINFKTFQRAQKPIPELKIRFAGKFVVSFIGGIDAVRGIEYLIEAANLLKNQINDICILLVGDGQSLDLIKKSVKEYKLENLVSIEGWQPSSSMQAYIEISDICIIPHIRSAQTDNSSPNKLFQYMFFGKPVISSNCTSIEKIINEENCGLIFPDRDSQILANQIYRLYKERDNLKQLGENGRQAVFHKYNWEATSKELLTVYQNE